MFLQQYPTQSVQGAFWSLNVSSHVLVYTEPWETSNLLYMHLNLDNACAAFFYAQMQTHCTCTCSRSQALLRQARNECGLATGEVNFGT